MTFVRSINKTAKSIVPEKLGDLPCVYMHLRLDARKTSGFRLVYVGQADNGAGRNGSHRKTGTFRNGDMLWIVSLKDKTDRQRVEAAIVQTYVPERNHRKEYSDVPINVVIKLGLFGKYGTLKAYGEPRARKHQSLLTKFLSLRGYF